MALEGGEGSASCPCRSLSPGNTRYSFHRRLGGHQSRSGQVRKISPPPGFDPRTVQPVASRYTDYTTRPTFKYVCIYVCVCMSYYYYYYYYHSYYIQDNITFLLLVLPHSFHWLIPNYNSHRNNNTFCQIIFQNRNVRKIKHVNLSLRSLCCGKYLIWGSLFSCAASCVNRTVDITINCPCVTTFWLSSWTWIIFKIFSSYRAVNFPRGLRN